MKKLLYVTHSAGYRHEVLPHSQEVLHRLGADAEAFEAVCTDNVADVDWNDLARYDAIAFCTTGELPVSDDAKNALIDFVRGGKAFIGIHNATDTFYQFAPYVEMVGGSFNGHPWHQEVGIIVEDRNHPATRGLPEHFTIHDEIYTHRNWSREKTHVLMRLDNSTVDLSKAAGNRDDNDFAMAWCHPFGAGRVFYTALGHDRPTWDSPLFHTHLRGGIQWAMRDAE